MPHEVGGFDSLELPAENTSTGSLEEMTSANSLGVGFEAGGPAFPAVPPPGEHPAGVPATQRVRFRTALLYSSGNLGSGIFYSFNNFILINFLRSLGAPSTLAALLSSQRSFEGAIIQPLVGAWSDRTWNRFGRRRPFIVWFMPISALLVIMTPFLPRLSGIGSVVGLSSTATTITLVGIGVFLFSIFFNIVQDPYTALLADIVPERQRGSVNGVFQAAGAIGQVTILVTGIILGVPYTRLFILTALAMLVFFLPTLFGIREPRALPGGMAHHRYTVRDYWNGLRADRQVQLYFFCQAFLWFGINAITVFITPFGMDVLGFDKSSVLILPLIILLSSSIFVWPLGILSDRFGLKTTFVLGMLCMSVASIASIVVRDHTMIYIVLALAGLGNAAQTASSYPLLTRIVLPDRMGLYTGLNTTVTSIAAPLSSLIAGTLYDIPHIGHLLLFPFVAAMFLGSLIPLALLRPEHSIAARARTRAITAAPMRGAIPE